MSEIEIRCDTVIKHGGCLKKPRRRLWLRSKKRVTFDCPNTSEDTIFSSSRFGLSLLSHSILFEKAAKLFLNQMVPRPPCTPSFDIDELATTPFRFNPRCQGLVQIANRGIQLFAYLPALVVLTRIWRELPIYPTNACFDIGDISYDLFERKCKGSSDELKWKLLLLNRIMMSDPSFDASAVAQDCSLSLKLGSKKEPSKVNYFTFTPAIVHEEEFRLAEPVVTDFVNSVLSIYDPALTEDDITTHKLYDICPVGVTRIHSSEATEDSVSTTDDDNVYNPPRHLVSGFGYRIKDVRQFKRVMLYIQQKFSDCVAICLMIDQILIHL